MIFQRGVSALTAAVLSCLSFGVAFADDPTKCSAVRMADAGWTDIALTNTTAQVLLEDLGYKPTQTLLATNVSYASLRNGAIDVFLGNWRPVQDSEFKAFFDDGSAVPVATNLSGAKYTLAVPSYVAEGGLRSFDDLQKYADKLDHKIYGIEAGSNEPLVSMLKARSHGLDGNWEVVESSEAAMLVQVQRAIKAHKWIVFLGWQPHPMNVNMDITYLSGGDAEFGPDFGGATVRTVVRKGYGEQCPNVTKLFANLVFDVPYENAGMNLIMSDKLTARAAAIKMIKAHPEKLGVWLNGVTTLSSEPALATINKAMEIQ